jgi:hypothetical protein
LYVDVGASGDGCRKRGVGTVAVADDVGGLVFGAILETEVGGCRSPADAFGWVGLIGIFVDNVAGVAGDVRVVLIDKDRDILLAVGDDAGDVAVACNH